MFDVATDVFDVAIVLDSDKYGPYGAILVTRAAIEIISGVPIMWTRIGSSSGRRAIGIERGLLGMSMAPQVDRGELMAW